MFTVSLAPARSETLGERRERKAAAQREGSLASASSTSSPELNIFQENSGESFPITRRISRTKGVLKRPSVSGVPMRSSPPNTAYCGSRNNSQDSGYAGGLSVSGVDELELEDNLADLALTDYLAVKPVDVNVSDFDALMHPGRRISISQFPSPPLTRNPTSEDSAPKIVPHSASTVHAQTWPLQSSPFPQQRNFSTPTGECPYAKKYFSQDTVFPDSPTVPEEARVQDLTEDAVKSLEQMILSTPEQICEGLRDQSDSLNQDEVGFNQRIWLLSAIERLRAPAGPNTKDLGNRILCLRDSVGDSYFIAARNPSAKVQGISANNSKPAALSSTRWPSLRNLSYLTRVGTRSAATPLPYSDNFFDCISAHTLPTVLRSTEWPFCLQECMRVLKPGGKFWVEFIDPMPKTHGPLLERRAVTGVIDELEKNGRSTRPGLLVPKWLKEAGFLKIRVEKLLLPAVNDRRGWKGELEARIGRMLYKSLYEHFAPNIRGGSMWWEEEAIVQECRVMGTAFNLTSVCCEKP